ncbi:MAG: hypothetical protein ACPG6L_10910 [Nereida ignava]
MMDILSELQTVGLTALFNPTFLFLLILLFFLGKLVGWMTRNINIWKFLALAYFGIFLFRPLQDAGLIIGGVFILGVASMYMDLFRGIFGWAGGIGDVVSAFRFNGAYKDIQRLEREIEALKNQMRASQTAGAGAGGTAQQSSWRAQSQARKSKPSMGTSTGGRGDRGQSGSTRGSRFSQNPKSGSGSTSNDGSRSGKKRSSAGSSSHQQKSRASDGPGGKPKNPRTHSTTGAKPSGNGKARQTGSQSRGKSQNTSQSQSNQQSTGGQQQGTSRNQSGSSGASTYTMSPALRDKYLSTLELTPGQTYTATELKAAWRKMAFKTHPDKGGSAAALSAVRDAYKALT